MISNIFKNIEFTGNCFKTVCPKRQSNLCRHFIQKDCPWKQSCKYVHQEQIFDVIVAIEKEFPDEVENNSKENKNDDNLDETL